jgi:hypothetical protein
MVVQRRQEARRQSGARRLADGQRAAAPGAHATWRAAPTSWPVTRMRPASKVPQGSAARRS